MIMVEGQHHCYLVQHVADEDVKASAAQPLFIQNAIHFDNRPILIFQSLKVKYIRNNVTRIV